MPEKYDDSEDRQPLSPPDPPKTSQAEWYFLSGSYKAGPIPYNELLTLHHSKKIKDDTLVWHPPFGSNWKPFVETVPDTPPPVPVRRVPDIAAWFIAIWPLLVLGAVGLAFKGPVIQLIGPSTAANVMLYSVWVLLLGPPALAEWDATNARRAGQSARFLWIVSWLGPLYLLLRTLRLRQSWYLVPISAIAFFWGAVAVAPTYFQKDFVAGLPTCEGEVSREQVKAVLDKTLEFTSKSMSVVKIRNIKEISRAPDSVTCTADIQTSRLEWIYAYIQHKKDEGQVFTEVTFASKP